MNSNLDIEIFCEGIDLKNYKGIDEDFFRAYFMNILESLDFINISLTIILTNDKFIHGINREYRNKDNPTDVISFANRDNPFPEIGTGPENLGDVYISLDKAREQALEYDSSFRDELKRLMIHGFLHLIGYDHEKRKPEAEKMRNLEEKIIQSL